MAWNNTEIHHYISSEDYHAEKYHLSSSQVKLFVQKNTPAHALYALKNPKGTTQQMEDGTNIHTVVLEYDRFMAEYMPMAISSSKDHPDYERCLKGVVDMKRHVKELGIKGKSQASKEELVKIIKENDPEAIFLEDIENEISKGEPGKIMLPQAEWDRYHGIAKAVNDHKRARQLIESSVKEATVYGIEEQTNLSLKVRPDAWRTDIGFISDVKSISSADDETISKSIFNFGYDISASMYLDGTNGSRFFWIFIESKPQIIYKDEESFGVRIIEYDNDWKRIGDLRYRQALDTILFCFNNEEFASYSQSIESVKVPPWIQRKFPNSGFL